MCGITGIWYPDRRPVPEGILRRMNESIRHRGPDDDGLHLAPGIGLAVRRLAIIDPAGGHQPFATEDGNLRIVFNGEIYNFRELRAELEGLGHRFVSRSDTEVCLRAFRHWGMDVWPRLEGMFGVAIWDSAARRLVLARDPLGIKPLYYAELGPGLAFGSELKCLFHLPGAVGEPDPQALDEYLAFGHVFAPGTFYTRARKLLPGHVLIAEEGRPIQTVRYWSLRFQRQVGWPESRWREELSALIQATVKRHLVADVPLGAFLSGGVDSSAVVAAMRRVHSGPLRTFSIGFRERSHDELPHARRVADFLGTNHTEQFVEVGPAETVLPLIAGQYDEPFADSSAIPTWYLSQLARSHVKVVLSGDGGDELFAGYPRYLNEKWMEAWRRVPAPVRTVMHGLVAAAPSTAPGLAAWRQRTLKRLEDAELSSTFLRFFSKCRISGPALRRSLYHPDFARNLDLDRELLRYVARHALLPVSRDPVENLQYADTLLLLPDDMLTKVDRASMAHSLEVRVPLLDRAIVEFAARMPVDLKLRGHTSKYLLREVARPWLPKGISQRRKQGFAVPLSSWTRSHLGQLAPAWLERSGIFQWGLLDPQGIRKTVEDHERGVADQSSLLYALVMLAAWHEGPDRIRREEALKSNTERSLVPPASSNLRGNPAMEANAGAR